MKSILLLVLITALSGAAEAGVFVQSWNGGFTDGGVIPDGNLAGWQDTRSVSVADTSITDLQVTLQISGSGGAAWNGDLYGYLTHGSGFTVLLNRPGLTAANSTGYGDNGFNVTFTLAASTDVHLYGGNSGNQVTGTYQADGRNISPTSSGATFDATSRTATLSSFTGLDPNGSWTLFMADAVGGDASKVTGWGMQITAVPEPVSMGIVATLLGGYVLARSMRRRTGLRTTDH